MHSNDTNIARMYILYMKISGIKLKMTQIFKDDQAFGVTPVKVDEQSEISSLKPGDLVKISGISKGKGFQGVVKRHGFRGHHTSRGTKDAVRMPGAIGAGGVQHVRKGQKMAGRMGGGKATVHNLQVVGIDPAKQLLVVKGAVPGARNSWVLVRGKGG